MNARGGCATQQGIAKVIVPPAAFGRCEDRGHFERSRYSLRLIGIRGKSAGMDFEEPGEIAVADERCRPVQIDTSVVSFAAVNVEADHRECGIEWTGTEFRWGYEY